MRIYFCPAADVGRQNQLDASTDSNVANEYSLQRRMSRTLAKVPMIDSA